MFKWDDTVKVLSSAPKEMRPDQLGSVVGISQQADRRGEYLAQFPNGIVYTVEFEDGIDAQIPEHLLEKGWFPVETPG